MLQRWAVRWAPRRPVMSTAAEVATLFDWLSITPPSRVSQVLHTLQQQQQSAPSSPSASSSEQSSLSSADLPNAVAQLAVSAPWPASHPRVWAEAIVLLTRSGSGSQAVTALMALPLETQRLVLQEATRRGLPGAVCREWRAQLGHGSVDSEEERCGDVTSCPRTTPPALAAMTTETTPPHAAVSASPALSVKEMSTQELVQHAFALHRPPGLSGETSSTAADQAVEALVAQQSALFRELAARGRYQELVQCVAHWHQKNLLMVHPESGGPGNASTARAMPSTAVPLFDGLQALKTALFPPTAATSHASAAAVVGSRAARHHLLTTQPILYARCIRDTRVAERLLRLDGPDQLRDVLLQLLRVTASTTATSRGATLPVLRADDSAHTHMQSGDHRGLRERQEDPVLVASLDTLWRGMARLARLLQPSLRRDRNVHKQALLSGLAAASAHTAALVPSASSSSRGSEKTVIAVRLTTESLCSGLLHNEAQVRFVGLPTFATIAEALEALSPSAGLLPNALVQCLLLSLAGPAATPPLPRGLRTTASTSATAAFLSADPLHRWLPALEMLQIAQEKSHFVVTSAHLRALLSGLQSVSIVRTWQQALACTDVCVRNFGLTPDESSLERLLLNLKQASWQDAFRVLDYAAPSLPPTSAAATSSHRRGKVSVRSQPAAVPARLLRDLQLVAVKHASWEVTLQLMDQLLAQEAVQQSEGAATPPVVGFMNRVYCVYAAASGGQLDMTLNYLASLAESPQYRSAEARRDSSTSTAVAPGVGAARSENPMVSPFNAVTVAIGAMAFLDHGHFATCADYSQTVLQRFSATADFSLTPGGRDMAQAAGVLGLLFARRGPELVDCLNRLASTDASTTTDRDAHPDQRAAPSPSTSLLSRVLEQAMVLQAMRNLQQLSAPVRLVFDTLAAGRYDTCDDAKSFETRQRGTNANRRPLYIPPRHARAQGKELAIALAELVVSPPVRADSSSDEAATLSAEATQQLASTLTTAGFGPEFLSVTLFGAMDDA